MVHKGMLKCLVGISIASALAICPQTIAKKTVINFYGRYAKSTDFAGIFDKAIKAYEKSHPDISIKYIGEVGQDFTIQLLTLAAAGQFPDIVNIYQPVVFDYAARNLIEPLPAVFTRGLRDKFYPTTISALTYKGKLYALPTENQVTGLVYNKKVLAETGIGVIPDTWTSLIEASRKVTLLDQSGKSFKRQGLAMQIGTWATQGVFRLLLHANGGDFLKGNELAFTGRLGESIIDDLREWYFARQIVTGNRDLISTGKVAFAIGYPWWANWVEPALKGATLDSALGVGDMPKGAVRRASHHYSWGLALGKSSKVKKEAMDFMKYLTTATEGPNGSTFVGASMATLGSLPSFKSDVTKGKFAAWGQWTRGFDGNLPYAFPLGDAPVQSQIEKALNEELTPFITGAKGAAGNPAQALANAKAKIQKALNRIK